MPGLVAGWSVFGEKCPSGHQILYNGNYFCDRWEETYLSDGVGCWGLSHPPVSDFDRGFHNRNGWQCCPEDHPEPCDCDTIHPGGYGDFSW